MATTATSLPLLMATFPYIGGRADTAKKDPHWSGQTF
jgi:hypothetical protein